MLRSKLPNPAAGLRSGPSLLLLAFVLARPAAAQDDLLSVLDVVSIQDREGFLDGVLMINAGEDEAGMEQLIALEKRWADDPDLYILRYNVACAFAKLGRSDEACDWLRRATESGYGLFGAQLQTLATDPDLSSLRGGPRFDEIFLAAEARLRDYREHLDDKRAPFVWTPPPTPVAEGEEPPPPPGVLIALHGYGQNPEDFARRHFLEFAKSRRLILVSLAGSELVSPGRWCWAETAAEFTGSFRLQSLGVWRALRELQREHEVDPERVIVTGLGQGASLAFAVAVRNPQWCKGAVLFSGALPPSCFEGWYKPAIHWGRRVAIVQGENDPLFEHDRIAAYVQLLSAGGLDFALRSHDGGFGVPEDPAGLASAFDWVDEKPLQKKAPSQDMMLNPGEAPRLPEERGEDAEDGS